MKRELKASWSQSVAPAGNRTTSTNGSAVDLDGKLRAKVVINSGTITNGTHTPSIEGSDDGSTGWAAVDSTEIIGTLAAISSSATQTVGYIGSKRYIRVVITVSGAPATGGIYHAGVMAQAN